MQIVPYKPELHLSTIELLLHMQGQPVEVAETLPFTGFIAEVKGTPIAAAFLRCAEGGVGIFDGLLSNPEASARLRHEALDNLILEICNAAYDMGIRKVLAYSIDANTIGRAQRLGFKQLEYILLIKEL